MWWGHVLEGEGLLSGKGYIIVGRPYLCGKRHVVSGVYLCEGACSCGNRHVLVRVGMSFWD